MVLGLKPTGSRPLVTKRQRLHTSSYLFFGRVKVLLGPRIHSREEINYLMKGLTVDPTTQERTSRIDGLPDHRGRGLQNPPPHPRIRAAGFLRGYCGAQGPRISGPPFGGPGPKPRKEISPDGRPKGSNPPKARAEDTPILGEPSLSWLGDRLTAYSHIHP